MTAALYVAPISPEIVRAAHAVGVHGFCASVGQVGPGAYTGFEYDVFARLRRDCRLRFGRKLVLERDHLGRNGEDMVEWTRRDIEHGFDQTMLHVFNTHDALEVIEKVPAHRWQVGPGEDDSRGWSRHLLTWRHPSVHEISFPTGCLIDGLTNRGRFDAAAVLAAGRPVRGHNCDYLTADQLAEVKRTCHAFNVAPQLGVLQSLMYLSLARHNGYPVREWEDACWADAKNVKRWCRDERQAVEGVGHYHFDLIEWRDAVSEDVFRTLCVILEELCS